MVRIGGLGDSTLIATAKVTWRLGRAATAVPAADVDDGGVLSPSPALDSAPAGVHLAQNDPK